MQPPKAVFMFMVSDAAEGHVWARVATAAGDSVDVCDLYRNGSPC